MWDGFRTGLHLPGLFPFAPGIPGLAEETQVEHPIVRMGFDVAFECAVEGPAGAPILIVQSSTSQRLTADVVRTGIGYKFD